jgi:DNA-binding NarL/FixJ family response regulator
MLVTDHLRFLLPALWDLYPREDMFTVPLVFIVAGLAGKGYAKAYALSLSAAAPREPVSAASAELAAAGLSARELEVAALLARGLTYKVIRSQLGISEGTVQSHVSSVYRKIGVNCKEDLIIRFGSALCGDRKPII